MASFSVVKYFHSMIMPSGHSRTKHFYTRTSSKVIVKIDYNIYTCLLSSLKQNKWCYTSNMVLSSSVNINTI